MERFEQCFKRGTKYEKIFASHLLNAGLQFESRVGTEDDLSGKIDFVVENNTFQVKSPSSPKSLLKPGDLTIEHRAVNGSKGWLHKVDYVVKFVNESRFIEISTHSLRKALEKDWPKPPEKAKRSKAIAGFGWYARFDWQGISRENECCIVVDEDWLIENTDAQTKYVLLF